MKSGLCCLLLLFVAAQARDLEAYGGGSYSHPSHSHHAPAHYSDCRKEVGYKIIAKDPKCGHAYCGSGHYCKTLKEVDCKYYPYGACPKYGFRYYTCQAIIIACGKTKCGFGYKCGKKKVCSTDYKEYHDGHKTTLETKKCWYEDACVKEDPPLICSYDGKYKKCYVDPKYAAIAAGVACGHSKCPPGHKCVGACKVCKYEVVAHPYCESVSYYSPIPCGSGVCNPYQTCAVSERTVCKKSGHSGYSYYSDGRHVSNHEKYSYYPAKAGYSKEFYYYAKDTGYNYHGSGYTAGSTRDSRGTGRAGGSTGTGSAGGSRKSPTSSPKPSTPPPTPTPSPRPPPPPPAAAASRSASTSTPTATRADSAIATQNGGNAEARSESVNPNAAAGSAVRREDLSFLAQTLAASNSKDVTADAGVSAQNTLG